MCEVLTQLWPQVVSHRQLVALRQYIAGGLRGAADRGEGEFSDELRFLYELAAVRFKDYE